MTSIEQIKEVTAIKRRVDEIESKVIKPYLSNYDNLPTLLNWYKDITRESVTKVEEKQKFLFIIITLYCPRFFAGYTLVRGLRDKIAEVFNLSPCHISSILKNIDFLYTHIPKFNNLINYVMPQIMAKIKEANLA